MQDNIVGARGGCINHSRAGLGAVIAGCVAGDFVQNNVVNYTVDGRWNHLAASNNRAFTAGHTAFANNNICLFAVWVSENNVFSTTQGKIVATADTATGKAVVPFPDVISNAALIGLIKVKAGVGATFTPGTTNLNASNITTTYVDCSVMPTAPFLA
jgi:hypothetical protein